jgi:hypothetical protein
VTANSPQWKPDQAARKKPSWYVAHQRSEIPPVRKSIKPREKIDPNRNDIVDAASGVFGMFS